MVVTIILAGCVTAPTPPPTPPTAPTTPEPTEQPPEEPELPPETPELPPEEPEPPPTGMPKPGEWTVRTGLGKFMLAFTVSPDGTGITEICYSLGPAFECGDYIIIVVETTVEESTPWPITRGQFTIDLVDLMMAAPFDLGMVIKGQFDETGTHASGTWEISADGTTCQEGTWEASAP